MPPSLCPFHSWGNRGASEGPICPKSEPSRRLDSQTSSPPIAPSFPEAIRLCAHAYTHVGTWMLLICCLRLSSHSSLRPATAGIVIRDWPLFSDFSHIRWVDGIRLLLRTIRATAGGPSSPPTPAAGMEDEETISSRSSPLLPSYPSDWRKKALMITTGPNPTLHAVCSSKVTKPVRAETEE